MFNWPHMTPESTNSKARSRAVLGGIERDYCNPVTGSWFDGPSEACLKNSRALNAPAAAGVERLPRGDCTLNCQYLPSRHLPPWALK